MAYQASTDIAALINDHWIPGVVDQLGEMSNLVKLLMRSDGITNMDANKPGLSQMVLGGEKVKRSVRHTRNASRGSMSGYDTLLTDPTRKFDFALFDWRTYYVALPQSLDEELSARGPEAVNSWMAGQLETVIADMMDLIATGVYNSAAGRTGLQNKGLNGLTEASAQGRTWGNINSSNYSWWDSGYHNTVAKTIANMSDPTHADFLLDAIVTLINGTTHRGKRPTHIITSTTRFDQIEQIMRDQKIYQGTNVADIGYEYLRYRGVEILAEHSDYFPDDYHMFAMRIGQDSTRTPLALKGREGAWFKLTDWRNIPNQLAKVRHLVAQCCLYSDEPRMLGMYTKLGTS